jgi:hypothetical protein
LFCALYELASHGKHVRPSPEYFPAVQSTHAPPAFLFWPLSQALLSTTQYVAPVPSAVTPAVVKPGGHDAHITFDIAVMFDVYVSLPQFWHSEDPLLAVYFPGSQFKHAVELFMPSCELYLPGSQSSHAADPVLFW